VIAKQDAQIKDLRMDIVVRDFEIKDLRERIVFMKRSRLNEKGS